MHSIGCEYQLDACSDCHARIRPPRSVDSVHEEGEVLACNYQQTVLAARQYRVFDHHAIHGYGGLVAHCHDEDRAYEVARPQQKSRR